jgi:protocatechuate 3,4-dioxygenase beta subunit
MTIGAPLLVLLLGIAQTAPPAGLPRDAREPDLKSGTGVISGRVFDAGTGAPMGRVRVTLSRLGTRAQLDTKTATNGTFQFRGVPAGAYAVSADPVGRPTHGNSGYGVIRGKGPGKHTTITLRDGEVFDKADIRLPRTYVISARVVDEDGDPVPDMLVLAEGFEGARFSRSRTTDDRGAVRLWGFSPGVYKLCATPSLAPDRPDAEGFVRTCYPAAAADAEAQPVTITDADPVEVEIRMRRSRLFRITGFVVDQNGQPAMDASVSLVTVDRNGGSSRTIRHEGGIFSVHGLAPGEYFIKAETQYRPDLKDSARPLGYAAVSVQTADVENLVVALSNPATVRGRLVFEGAPAPSLKSLSVQATPGRSSIAMASGRWSQPAAVKPDLSFEIEGIVGPQLLDVRGVPRDWVVRSVRYGGEERINVPTEFKSHIDPSALEIVLTNRPARLVARVTDEKGQPVEDARVLIFPADPRQWDGGGAASIWRFGVPREGTYEFNGLRPADYLVVVIPDGMPFQDRDRRPLEALSKHAERITLLENDVKAVDLEVRR